VGGMYASAPSFPFSGTSHRVRRPQERVAVRSSSARTHPPWGASRLYRVCLPTARL